MNIHCRNVNFLENEIESRNVYNVNTSWWNENCSCTKSKFEFFSFTLAHMEFFSKPDACKSDLIFFIAANL